MSVYRDTNAVVNFAHPHPGPLDVAIYRDGIKLREILAVSPVSVPGNKPNKYTINVNYEDTQYDGKLEFVWTNGTFRRTTSEDVVTPLISIERLRTLFEDSNWSDDKLMDLEKSVRIAIQSFTRQSFGYYIGTRQVVGNGDTKIALPGRLLKHTNINGGPPGYFAAGNDGWYLYLRNKNLFTIKEMPPEDYIDNNLFMTQGVIVVPDTYWKQFRVGAKYTITGEWGYYSVPEDIEEAAYLIANDIACGDSIYRDRYIENMKSADWNLVFNEGAYRGTGNVRADQLLAPYRREGMVII